MSALGDVIVEAIKELLRELFEPITAAIENHSQDLIRALVGTPYPNSTFSRPTNEPWPAIYDYYWDMIVPLSLSLWALAIGLVIFLESTSYLFGSYHRSKLKKRAFSGLLGLLSWWWIAAISLRFMDALADTIAPDPSNIALFETLSFGAMGVLGVVFTLSADLALFVLVGLIYFTRHVVLYLYVLLMPLLIVLWIPGVGPFALSSQFMKRLSGFYVPFLFMTIPVALLFQLGALLGHSFGVNASGIGAWIAALIIPFLAVLSPIILFWQAGALFFVADRVSHRVSTQRAQARMGEVQNRSSEATHSARNFTRGLRGRGARSRDGEQFFGSGNSRANRSGLRLRAGATDAKAGIEDRVFGRGSSDGPVRNEAFQNLRSSRSSSGAQQASSADRSGPSSTTEHSSHDGDE